MPREWAWPHSVHEILETARAVGVREVAIGQIYAMCFHIHPLRDPPFMINCHSTYVSNESARTTDRNQRRFFCKRTTSHERSEQGGFQRHIGKSPFHGSITKNSSLFQSCPWDNATYLAQPISASGRFPSLNQIIEGQGMFPVLDPLDPRYSIDSSAVVLSTVLLAQFQQEL